MSVTPTDSTYRRAAAPAVALAATSVAIAIVVCSAIIAVANPPGVWRTLALLWAIAIAGVMLIFRSAARTNDARVLNLSHVWALKLVAGLAVLYFGWVPELDLSSVNYGYDPQRFYFQANDLQEAGYNTAAIPSINYTGVLYVYGAVFQTFGHNAFAPALINALVALWCILAAIRFLHAIPRTGRASYWLVGLTLLIPEMIWFDDLVSRETLSAALTTVGILGCTSYLLPRQTVRRLALVSFKAAIPSLLILGILRMSVLAASLVAIGFIYFAHRMTFRQRAVAVLVLLVMMAALAAAPAIISRLGGYDFNIKTFNPARRAKTAMEDPAFQWAQGSIGRRLIGDTMTKLVIFTPPRMVLYLILPLPRVDAPLDNLATGRWLAWQNLLTALSAAIYVILIPFVLALGIDVLRKRAPPGASIVFLAFGVIFTLIVAGNQILHERYRIMSIPLLVACAVLGRNSSRFARRAGTAIWICTIAAGVAAYL
ncbi:MAG TPA: hypothetical protein VN181_03250, partial [Thermoanaerobaculia bacterium]|nr:hypothetical protein [Thermoanaerobaculia bacterium]